LSHPTAYLFLEVALVALLLALGWRNALVAHLSHRTFLRSALLLACCWFAIDKLAVALGLWSFPKGGTLPFRLFSLPAEEYALFFLSTFACSVLLGLVRTERTA
jgi:lycopene cyclase domain-containing protein